MRFIIALFALVLPLAMAAQIDTTRPLLPISGNGFIWKQGKFGALYTPQDTPKVKAADAGAIAYKGGLNVWNGASWEKVGGGNWYNVKANGGDNTGATDVSTLVNAALAAGIKDIYFPKGKYQLSAPIQLKDGATLYGDGRGLTTLFINGDIKGISGIGTNGGYGAQISNLSIQGTKSAGATSAQIGIYLDSVSKVLVHNVKITNVGGAGIHVQRNGYCCATYTQTATRGNTISDCYIDSSGIGIYLKEGTTTPSNDAEYNKIIGCTLHGNVVGARIGGGNNTIASTTITYSTSMGLYLTGGSNNGHGIVDGCTINHNYRSLYIDGATKGVSMTGNNIHSEDSIVVRGSSYVNIVGGWFYAPVVYYDNSTNCIISATGTLVGNEPTITVGTGEAPTYIKAGKSDNTLSWIDAKNNKEFAIGHTNGVVTFTGLISQSTAADSMMVINPSTGSVGYRSIPSGGGGSGITTVGAFSASAQTGGASISGSTITFGPATPSGVGMVTNTAQTIAGTKTFTHGISAGSGLYGTGLPPFALLYDGGAGGSYGWFLNSSEMQHYIPNSAHFSWNKGGLQNGSTVNELMRLDAGTGTLSIGTTSPSASAILELNSTTQGFLPPRMTATQASAISSPAQGLMVFVTSTNGTFTTVGWWGWTGSIWSLIGN